jgi:hypothetical protein
LRILINWLQNSADAKSIADIPRHPCPWIHRLKLGVFLSNAGKIAKIDYGKGDVRFVNLLTGSEESPVQREWQRDLLLVEQFGEDRSFLVVTSDALRKVKWGKVISEFKLQGTVGAADLKWR